MKKNSFLQIFIFISIFLIIFLLAITSKNKTKYYSNNTKSTSRTNREYNLHYKVDMPKDFFINFKDYQHFQVAENIWKNNFSNIPTAGVTILVNYIPTDMTLDKWLNDIGDPNSPAGSAPAKECYKFIDMLNDQYHTNIETSHCLYYSVTGIKETKVGKHKGITFQSSNTSYSATHTLIKIDKDNQALLFDIYYTTTGLSSEKDKTKEAYQTLLKTIKFN